MRLDLGFRKNRLWDIRAFAVVCALVGLVAGCAPDEETGSECVVSSDCTAELVCSNGFCVSASLSDSHEGDTQDTASTDSSSDAGQGDVAVLDTFVPNDVLTDAVEDVSIDTIETDIEGEVTEDVAEEDADAGEESDIAEDTVEDIDTEDIDEDTFMEDVSLEDVEEDTGTEDVEEDIVEDVEEDLPPPGPVGLGEVCDGNCLDGYICKQQQDGLNRCEYFPKGVCAPCKNDADCLEDGAKCLVFGGGSSYCGSPCVKPADCPTDFLCSGSQCIPKLGNCGCGQALLGYALACENSSELGDCTGTILCDPATSQWKTCTAVYPIPEKCDGIDNDCNGVTDEGILYYEKGQWLNIGDDCGLGECGPGQVVCSPDGEGVCSSIFKAQPESCVDVLDNDCDGYVNEECEYPDFDGDGVANEDDCEPQDAGIHPGAKEKCCLNGEDPACDMNCDGVVTACDACDLDGDGFCAPDDCGEGDPTVYPGAPEKCDDGIDQNCQGGDLLCPPFQDQDGDGYIPPADCGEGNPAVYPGAAEVCDNLDNDCDGFKDEGNPQAGDVCGEGDEFCSSGLTVCSHTGFAALIQCVGALPYGVEVCDGKDNDCNGSPDDVWPDLGGPCDGPDVDACAYGVVVCKADESGVECGPEEVENMVETCNELDDDCDGATDEFVCPVDDVDADGVTPEDGDCDDFRAEVYPGAQETCCDPALGAAGLKICDLNCDGIVIPCALSDKDTDGFTTDQGDCDDTSDKIFPGAPEICDDGIDQDCTVGDLDCALVTDQDGDGYHQGVDCNDSDPDVHPWATETCNFIDDDCDQIIDDGNPSGKVGPCAVESPGCGPGQWICMHDLATYTTQIVCANDQFQAPELCNGLDDDCDGDVDEAFLDLGAACDGADTDSCANGVIQCTEDGLGVECGPESESDIPELCDGLDNDCDEVVDEDLNYEGVPLGAECQGIGACGPGVVVCMESGEVVCSTNPDGPFPQVQDELCNNLDDDCDGDIDEGFTWNGFTLGETCEGEGVCGTGVVECGNLNLPTCSTHLDGTESQASAETCNLEDDDCDGAVDEELELLESPCKVEGLCTLETVSASCDQGQWSCDYSNVAGYQEEETLCDQQDNDCDGVTDEDMPVGTFCDGPDSDQCETGLWACAPDGVGVVCEDEVITDLEEVCNGVDDDCDGYIDEVDLEPAEAGCNTTGVCSLTWAVTVYCGIGDNFCDYSEVPFYEAEETLCDGLDNDCDGLVDEGLTYEGMDLGTLCQGKGECGTGVVQCSVDTKEPICSTEPGGFGDQSSPELCNGLDDDCDGVADEDYVWEGVSVGDFCTPGGVCGTGLVECSADKSSSTCSTASGGSQDMTAPEECDGVDNDCDGDTDEIEELDINAAACPTAGICSDLSQFVVCQDGSWLCDYGLLPSYQGDENNCDGLDNDCDGAVDESYPLLGTPCDGADDNVCPTGTWTCKGTADGLECVNETNMGTPEVCDGADNDCDGLADEGMTYKGVPLGFLCDGMGPCGVGFVECAGDGTASCSTNYGGSQSQATDEICNGLDDDCDGLIDNGMTWEGKQLGQPCDGTGGCGLGLVECSVQTGLATCSTNPEGSTPQGIEELCNGVDDDCDGEIDEEVANLGVRCDGLDGDACQTGVTACSGGKVACVNDVACVLFSECFDPGEPAAMICLCNGLDACSVQMGDKCGLEGCSCNGGEPCFKPSVCVPGVGCEIPDE